MVRLGSRPVGSDDEQARCRASHCLVRREPFPISKELLPCRTILTAMAESFSPDRPRANRCLGLSAVPEHFVGSIIYARSQPRRPGLCPSKMDVHVPVADGQFPLVIYLPGGGFAAAPRQMARAQRGYVADAGFVVASVTYRTVSDGATFRDGLADVCAAIAYMVENADDYKIATGGVAPGESQPADTLAALAATTCTPVAPVKAVITIVGGTDISQISDGFDDAAADAWLGPQSPLVRYVGNPAPLEANPVAQVGPSALPFLLMHGDDDRIVSPRQSLLMHHALLVRGPVA